METTRKQRQALHAKAVKRLASVPENRSKRFPGACNGNRHDWWRANNVNGLHYVIRGRLYFAGDVASA